MTFVALAKIQVSVDGQIITIGVSSTAYRQPEPGLYHGRWFPILDTAIGLRIGVKPAWQGGPPTDQRGTMRLNGGRDGISPHLLDLFLDAQVSGLETEHRRGYTHWTWDDMEFVTKSHNDLLTWEGEQLSISLRSALDKTDQPLINQVFDEQTPNARIVNREVPLLLGPAFQIEPLLWDAQQQMYYIASNLGNISAAKQGGALTDNTNDLDFGFQMLSGNQLQEQALQITADAIGPPSDAQSQTTVVDWLFDAWLNGEPNDGDETFEAPPEAEIEESAAGDEADITVLATPTADTGWLSIQNPIEPLFSGLSSNDAWTASGAASVEAAVVADDGSFAEATIFGPQTLRVGSFRPALPEGDEVTGVEIEVIADGTNAEISMLTANQRSPGTRVAAFVDANGEVEGSGILPDAIGSTKATILGGGPNFVGGGIGVREDVNSSDVNDPGMHFSLQVTPAVEGAATVRIYQVRIKVHHRPNIEIVRRFTATADLAPGERHTITIETTAADIYARWGGSDAVDGLLKDADDPFSTSLTRLQGPGRATFDFVPGPGEGFFGIEFKRLNSAGTATINRITVRRRQDGINKLKSIVPYMAGLLGLADNVDQQMIDAHDDAIGSPEMGGYVTGNESMSELMDFFARNSAGGVWWRDRDAMIRSRLWRLDPNATPIFRLTKGRIVGKVRIQSDAAENATDRAVAAKNQRPLRVSEVAGRVQAENPQEFAALIEDFRVRRRANFGSLNPWTAPSDGDGGGITTQVEFTTAGADTWTVPSDVSSVEVLVVAGGGGGGGNRGGGGGAGGLIHETSFAVTPDDVISLTVGGGGAGGSNFGDGSNGADSVFDTLTAIGGGGGAGAESNAVAGNGGSGGGAGHVNAGAGGTGTAGQGNDGGATGINGSTSAAGGGGAGAAGQDDQNANGGDGGAGVDKSATFGTSVGDSGWFAGGGGGGGWNGAGGLGGQGGGGDGAAEDGTTTKQAGTANTGGGGGGGTDSSQPGMAGGSGIIIIRYTA